MSAIITTQFRQENATNFYNAVADAANTVYLTVGKSDAWSDSIAVTADSAAPTPLDSQVEVNDAWQNMISMKKASAADIIHIAPRHTWSSGDSYVAWDDADTNLYTQSYYMITDEFKVYKCILAGTGASTVKPTQTNVAPTAEGDGYTWKYMFTVATVEASKFLTNSYLPVKTVVLAAGQVIGDLSAEDQTKYTFQLDSAANVGKIYRGVVTAVGSGYTGTPTVTIYGDGTGATATAVKTGNTVTGITITGQGANYSVAYAVITGGSGTGATCRVILSPANGHGTDPVRELNAFYIGIAVRLEYIDGGGDFIVNNKFRQLAIVKNPYNYGTTVIATATTRSALKSLQLSAHTGLVSGDYITGNTSGAIAFIDDYDGGTGIVKYHQNDKTGYVPFQVSEGITGNTGGTGTVQTSGGLINPEVARFTGQLLFLENRAPINRSASQIEDVKLILEF